MKYAAVTLPDAITILDEPSLATAREGSDRSMWLNAIVHDFKTLSNNGK